MENQQQDGSHGAQPGEYKVLDTLFSALVCAPVNFEIGRRAGEYLGRYHASHRVELGDALVAATAVVHGAALWTRNRKHYPMPEILLL